MSPREKYIAIIANDALKTADAIVILEGDLFVRIREGARLYKDGWAPTVVLSGGDVAKRQYARPASEMLPELIKAGVPENSVVLETRSQHTRDQAVEIVNMAKEKNWKAIIIVASHYHQYRAYLTFVRALQEGGLALTLINAPQRQIKWWEETGRGQRIDLLEEEFRKIEEYREKGHVATYEDAITYQQWKESQS